MGLNTKIEYLRKGGSTHNFYKMGCKYSVESINVPFFFKQMSNKAPIPKDLMVREYPKEMEQE